MGFVNVVNAGGSREKVIFSSTLAKRSNQLKVLYEGVLEAIKRYEIREGYKEVDEQKERLLKVKLEIEELSNKINNTINKLK